jgi:hypothetical protein
MTTKLRIDLSQGVLEVEGSEHFVKAIYSDFKSHFIAHTEATPKDEKPSELKPTPKPKTPRPAKSISKPEPAPIPQLPEVVPPPEEKPPPPYTYTYIENLSLEGGENRPALVEFMDAKMPITNEERNLVFLYYLQYILDYQPINLDAVYTCYKATNIRVPHNIETSLRMTADYQGWIKASTNGQMSVTHSGKNYVEKQLPQRKKA